MPEKPKPPGPFRRTSTITEALREQLPSIAGVERISVREAATGASRDRLRAVLFTSLTTFGGLIPLLFEKSLQTQFLIPMAVTMVFGLALATLLVLFLVPASARGGRHRGIGALAVHAARRAHLWWTSGRTPPRYAAPKYFRENPAR